MVQPEKKRPSLLAITLKYVVPLVISVGLCWLLFHDFDYREMMALVRDHCHIGWVLAGMGITVCAHVFRALRWRLQLRALGIDCPVFYLIISIFGTYAVNLVFPRLGEIWRTGYIAQRQHAPFTTVFGSMVCDRLADTATVLLLTLLAFVLARASIVDYLSENGEALGTLGAMLASPWLWGAAAACVTALWLFLRWRTSLGWVRRVQRAFVELWQGFIVIGHMPGKGAWLLYTLGIWGCFFGAMAVEFLAFDFTADVLARGGLTVALTTFVLSSISMAVPSNGGIGPWQWAVIFALGIYGLPALEGGTFANLIMAATTMLNILLGIFTFSVIALGRRRRAAAPGSPNQTSNTPKDII